MVRKCLSQQYATGASRLYRMVLLFWIVSVLAAHSSMGDSPGVDAGKEVSFNIQWSERMFSESNKMELPFSFVYDGKHSAEFIGSWHRQVKDKTIDATKRQRILTLTDPQTKLEVRAVATIYTDTAGVDWTIYFTRPTCTTNAKNTRKPISRIK